MKLKYIETVNFRQTEQTNFEALPASVRSKLGEGDVVLFVSKGGNQLVFVHGFVRLEGDRRVPQILDVLRSERFRMSGGTWNPLMLKNYADEAGIKLDGLQRFEQHYARIVAERRGRR